MSLSDTIIKLIVDEEEAKVVRRIYREYLEGYTVRDIAKGLERDKVMTGSRKYRWHKSTVEGILRNEKYIGDALLQKTITIDFIEKTRIDNDGSVPQYYVTGNHEAIIPRDVFAQVQEEMLRRNNLYSKNGKKRFYSGKYALTGICTCTRCGDTYCRKTYIDRGKRRNLWECATRIENGGPEACDAPLVMEHEIHEAVLAAINQVLKCSKNMKEKLKENIEAAIAFDNTKDLEAINKILAEKQQELLLKAQAKKDYSKIAEEVDKLQEEKKKVMLAKAQNEGIKRKVTELNAFIEDAPDSLTEYDDKMVRKYIGEVKIYDDRFRIFFKAGIDIEIPRK